MVKEEEEATAIALEAEKNFDSHRHDDELTEGNLSTYKTSLKIREKLAANM